LKVSLKAASVPQEYEVGEQVSVLEGAAPRLAQLASLTVVPSERRQLTD